jgi:hypothetical protein
MECEIWNKNIKKRTISAYLLPGILLHRHDVVVEIEFFVLF